MRNFIFGLFCGLLITSAYAGKINSPPPLSDEPPAEQAYFQEIYENINKFQVTSTAPNASRKGVQGEPIIYNNTGTLELWVNYDSNLTWQKI